MQDAHTQYVFCVQSYSLGRANTEGLGEGKLVVATHELGQSIEVLGVLHPGRLDYAMDVVPIMEGISISLKKSSAPLAGVSARRSPKWKRGGANSTLP